MMKTIGLDLSINSTGICVCNGNYASYFIITNTDKKSKKLISAMDVVSHNPDVPLKYYLYNKCTSVGLYSDKEIAKTYNITSIGQYLDMILKEHKPDHAFIEGISYGSVGSAALADLAGLNFVVRWILTSNNIPFTIVSPSSNKQNATGNGRADKDEMMWAWINCDNRLKEYKDILKLDDIADAYFLAKTKIECE